LDFDLARSQTEADQDTDQALRKSALGVIVSRVDALASRMRRYQTGVS
jgi:hypothetical protein